MKATLCQHTVENAFIAYPEIRGAVLHSDRGSQYTSELYRSTLRKYEIIQSMNSAGGRCHDNARCESMWARLKTEPGNPHKHWISELHFFIQTRQLLINFV